MKNNVNNKKSPRGMALFLAIVLMIMPFFVHAGFETDTKAAIDANDVSYVSFEPDAVLESIELVEKNVEDQKCFGVKGSDSVIDVFFDGEKVNCSLGQISADSIKGQTPEFTGDFELLYRYEIVDSIPSDPIKEEESLKESEVVSEVEDGQFLVTYIKLVLDEDAQDVKIGETTYTAREFNEKSAYMSYVIYKIKKADFIGTAEVKENAGWKKRGEEININLNSDYEKDDSHLGIVKMAFVRESEGKDDDYYIENASWINYKAKTKTNELEDGIFKVCIGYFNEDDKIVKSKVIDSVKIDSNNSATYTIWLQSKTADGVWEDAQQQEVSEDNSFSIKWEDEVTYRLALSAEDGEFGSGIATVLFGGTVGNTDSNSANYYKTLSAASTNMELKIIDNAGNEKVSSLTFEIDSVAPSFMSLEVSEKDGEIVGAPHNTYRSPVISYSVKDDKNLAKIELYSSTSEDGQFVKFSDIPLTGTKYTGNCEMPQTIATGDCYIKVIVYDRAGHMGQQNINFIYDYEPPVVNSVKYQYSMKDETGNYGEWITWKDEDGKHIVNNHLVEKGLVKYSFTFEVEDKCAGIKSVTNKGEESLETIEDNCFRFIFEENSTDNDIVISIEDKVGNINDFTIEKSEFSQVNSGLAILSDTVKLCDKNNPDDIVDLSATKFHTNRKYLLMLSAISEYEIASAKLNAIDENGNNISLTAVLEAQEYAANTGLYTARFVFDIPGKDVNTLLKNCNIVVTDTKEGKPQTATKKILDILYDISLPRLLGTNADTIWHKSFELKYTVKSGEMIAESALQKVAYAITNSSDNGEVVRETDSVIYTGVIDVPESKTVSGTKIEFSAVDNVGNTIYNEQKSNIVIVKVDKHLPEIKKVMFDGNALSDLPYKKAPKISTVVTDNLSLKAIYADIKYPDGTVKTQMLDINEEKNDIEKTADFLIEKVDGVIPEGKYEIEIYAEDLSERMSQSELYNLIIDNTAPTVNAIITEGKASKKTKKPYYYKSNVQILLTYTDICIDKVIVTDNGVPIKNISWAPVKNSNDTYSAKLVVSKEQLHKIAIYAVDKAGNNSNKKSLTFVVDKTAPSISANVNGAKYTDLKGLDMSFSPAKLAFFVDDMCVDDGDNYIKIVKKLPNGEIIKGKYIKTSNKELSLSEEAEYTISMYSIDKAQNKSAVKTVKLRVDAVAPEILIQGVTNGQTLSEGTTLSFIIREAFWKDASGSVDIYSKLGDGMEERLLKSVELTPTAYETSVSELLSETGIYRFELKASDRAGHTVNDVQTITIDKEAPVITRTGVNDYDKISANVTYNVSIDDAFYSSKGINVKATRTDMDGKVTDVSLGEYSSSANPTVINKVFDEDGIYDIELEAKDVAGNTSTDKIHFVVDKTAPSLDDIAGYDGKVLSQFVWDKDVDSIVSDLTVCDVRMYLNGKEYDGMSVVEDGSYILKIVATDELGHETEKEISFELDTKAPNIIVTGVEDGQVQEDAYDINVSLQLDGDTLDSVILDGETVTVANNTCTINVSDKGKHTLEIKAVDAAGNEAQDTITFTVGSKTPVVLIIVICACAVALGIAAIIIIRKRKNK